MPTFEDLRIWQEAHLLMNKMHELCKTLPRDERFRLRDQIERSSASICDNIAEGYTAYYYNEKVKTMYIARKEAGETQNHLRSMQSRKYITKSVADELFSRYQVLIRGINGFVRFIINKRDALKTKKGD
jgi:four helix bundle protein